MVMKSGIQEKGGLSFFLERETVIEETARSFTSDEIFPPIYITETFLLYPNPKGYESGLPCSLLFLDPFLLGKANDVSFFTIHPFTF